MKERTWNAAKYLKLLTLSSPFWRFPSATVNVCLCVSAYMTENWSKVTQFSLWNFWYKEGSLAVKSHFVAIYCIYILTVGMYLDIIKEVERVSANFLWFLHSYFHDHTKGFPSCPSASTVCMGSPENDVIFTTTLKLRMLLVHNWQDSWSKMGWSSATLAKLLLDDRVVSSTSLTNMQWLPNQRRRQRIYRQR